MKLKVTKKQNVKVDGVKYVPLTKGGCNGCAFDDLRAACDVAPCSPGSRYDQRNVIFVKKATD